jgi:hypothetical protein
MSTADDLTCAPKRDKCYLLERRVKAISLCQYCGGIAGPQESVPGEEREFVANIVPAVRAFVLLHTVGN